MVERTHRNGNSEAVRDAKQLGAVLISGVVYAQLIAHPNATPAFVNEFCDQTSIIDDFTLTQSVWKDAGVRFANYANRRSMTTGESPRNLLAGFLIGSHALLQADRLMTLDSARYKRDFPDLQLA